MKGSIITFLCGIDYPFPKFKVIFNRAQLFYTAKSCTLLIRIVEAANASRAAKTAPVENASTEVSESTVINTTDLSDASVVVADVLNEIVNTIDGVTADGTVDPTVKSEDSAKGCGFAIDTVPTVEKGIAVKSENDLQEDSVQKDPSVETSFSESDAHELKNRFLTAARYVYIAFGEK